MLKNKLFRDPDPTIHIIKTYALITEVIKRVLHLEAYGEQILAAIALALGKLIEMQTGEGKTLVATYPALLFGMTGKGVHILTFNDYLAKRDAQWMKPIYDFFHQKKKRIPSKQLIPLY